MYNKKRCLILLMDRISNNQKYKTLKMSMDKYKEFLLEPPDSKKNLPYNRQIVPYWKAVSLKGGTEAARP